MNEIIPLMDFYTPGSKAYAAKEENKNDLRKNLNETGEIKKRTERSDIDKQISEIKAGITLSAAYNNAYNQRATE